MPFCVTAGVTGNRVVFPSVVPQDADFRFPRFPRVLPVFFSSCRHPSEPLFVSYCVTLAFLRSLCLPRPLCTTVDHSQHITSSAVINVHVPFGDTTETFLEHLMEAYRQLAMIGPTVIIGDFNAAPSADDCGRQQTPEDAAVQVAMQHLGLQDLTASLRGQPSHRPPQPCWADSRIDLCYADSAHVEVARTQYHDLPSKITGH